MKSVGTIQKNTEKRASHDVLFPLCENAADKLILLVLLGSVLLFILWPIACIALRSLRGADGGVSFAMFGTVLRQYGESLRNSVFVGVFTAVLSTILSLSAALVCATARGWKKTLCMVIMLVAMVSPPFVSSLAYIQLYGRRGWITYRLLHLSLNPYNRWGVILMQSISFVPLNAMFLSGILEKLDEGSLRSARDLGASGGAILRDIVLPLIRPATLVCLLLSFVRSLADFGTPIIIGGRFSTLAADIYLQVVGYSDLEKSSAMNMFLLVPSIVFFFVYRALMRRSDRLTDASRTAQTELGLSLPHCGAMGWGMIALSTVFFVMIVLQYGCVFLSGFLKSTKGVYSFTLQYWDQLWRIGSSTMLRSVEYALIVSIAGTVFAMLLHGPPAHPWPQLFRLPGDAALYAAGHVLRHRLHSRVQPRAAQADGHGPYRAGQHALQAAADLHEDLHRVARAPTRSAGALGARPWRGTARRAARCGLSRTAARVLELLCL